MAASYKVKFLELCSTLDDELAEILRRWAITLNASATRKAYQNYVIEFIGFIKDVTFRDPCVDDLNHSNITLAYVSYLRKKHMKDDKGGYCSSTAVSKMAAVRSLYKIAYKYEFITSNPMAYAPSIKALEGESADVLEEHEVIKLLSYMDKISLEAGISPLQRYTRNLYRAMFYVIMGTGMRVCSVVSIKIKDFRGDTLSIYEKRGKPHLLKLNEQTSKIISNWIESHKPLSRPADYLFTSRDNIFKPLSEIAFSKSVKKYVKASGIDKHITPHSFRGTVISLLHWQGVEGRRIQSLMGHKSYTTTLKYLNTADEIKNPVTDYLIFENKVE